MSNRYDSVLFDLDGTLTDAGPGIMRCAALAMDALHIPYENTRDCLRIFVGPPLWKTFLRFGVPEDQVEEAIRIYRYHYHQGSGKFENSPYEGIREALDQLCREGYALYVATSKPEGLAIEILQRFDLARYFRIIGGATEDHSRENKNDVIRYLLDKIGDAGHTIMVGDTVFDVEGAADLGIPCIGVSWGYGSVPEMRGAGAAGIADTMDQLLDLIRAGRE